ncbi:MAG: hypothetical protein KGL90_08850 [Burkholderiales bacterium]|nr:hypothetical protein [Burkholderiales bacterium]
MSQGPVLITLQGRTLRERHLQPGAMRCLALPLLGVLQRELLRQWARSDGLTRQWRDLLKLGGPSQIEASEQLAELLLNHGWLSVKERFDKGSWHLQSITWLGLPALKSVLGLSSQQERQTQRHTMLSSLADWAQAHPMVQAAVQSLVGGATLPVAKLQERIALLHALVRWQADQRTGTRRDFALDARDDTKSLSEAEWSWLDTHVDLPALGIERFMPQLWLAGALRLSWAADRYCDLHELHCVGLAAHDLLKVTQASSPRHYWLIENRGSFERQAAQRDDGVALIWLPGRPSSSWMSAVGALLDHAPAPARISTDPDPAGVEIALTAASLWDERAVPWQAHLMGIEQLKTARKTRPLSEDHDPMVLTRLAQRTDMPDALRELCEYMRRENVKAEQEGWL